MSIATPPADMWVLWEVRRYISDEEENDRPYPTIVYYAEPVGAIVLHNRHPYPVPVSALAHSVFNQRDIRSCFIAKTDQDVHAAVESVISKECERCGYGTDVECGPDPIAKMADSWEAGLKYEAMHKEDCPVWTGEA